MPMCPKCKRKRRVVEHIEKEKGKKYFVGRCISCKTPLEMEEINNVKPFKIES